MRNKLFTCNVTRGNAYCTHTGTDRPSLKDLYDHLVTSLVNNVANTKWINLGVQLLQTHEIDMIVASHHHNVITWQCVLQKWLETNINATWNQLIEALRRPSIQLDYLASQLEQMLIPERKIMSTYQYYSSCTLRF